MKIEKDRNATNQFFTNKAQDKIRKRRRSGRRPNGEVSEKITTNDQGNSKKIVNEDYEINTKGGPPAKKLRRFWKKII